MKRILISALLPFFCWQLSAETTTTIGTGTATQEKPFGVYYGYERSAAVYTGSFGYIISLGWYVGTANPVACPVKIYLKAYGSSTLSVTTWTNMVSGATLVFDGVLNFSATGWQTVDIADFVSSGSYTLVLCETNYGGLGASTNPTFRYSNATSTHEYWQGDAPPTGSGTRDNNRPNIQITYVPQGTPVPPSGFRAVATGSTEVSLNWVKNSAGNDVMVAYNTVNQFGTPSGTYSAGSGISGGGTVIYNGPAGTFVHTGLTPSTTYYYRAWSVLPPTPAYSTGTGSAAVTLCEETGTFPYLADFEPVTFPPQCWMLLGMPWIRSASASGYGSGTGAVKADFFNTVAGNFDLISPELDLTTLTDPKVTFDFAYATYSTQVDTLEVLYSSDNGLTYTVLNSWSGGISGPLNTGGATTSAFVPAAGQWATRTVALSPAANRVLFRGISLNGNNLYLDNITFSGACDASTTPVATITPGGPTTFCEGGSVDLTASGGTTYLWSTGDTAATISVTEGGTYTVSVTNSSGCSDDASIGVTMLPASVVSVSVWASANPVNQGTEVTFTAVPVNGGQTPSYTWYVNGAVAGSANGNSFSYAPNDQDMIHCMLLSSETCTAGNPAASNTIIISVNSIPSDTTIQGVVDPGESACFDAVSTLTIAGSGQYFSVAEGGIAIMIAGGTIRYLQGTAIASGGYLHGFITHDNEFCPPASKRPERNLAAEDNTGWVTGGGCFTIYPNPTCGDFIIRQAHEKKPLTGTAEIISMHGKTVLRQELNGEELYRCRFSGFPAGLYSLRILAGGHFEIKILVKSAE